MGREIVSTWPPMGLVGINVLLKLCRFLSLCLLPLCPGLCDPGLERCDCPEGTWRRVLFLCEAEGRSFSMHECGRSPHFRCYNPLSPQNRQGTRTSTFRWSLLNPAEECCASVSTFKIVVLLKVCINLFLMCQKIPKLCIYA